MGAFAPHILAPLFAAVLVILLSRRRLRDAVIEALDNFRGGPPSPMHPSPSNDGALLRKLSLKGPSPD